MMETNILHLILGYCDLKTYYSLINNKKFSLSRYYKLQTEMDIILSHKIKKFWKAMNTKILKLYGNHIQVYFHAKNMQDTIKKIIDALEICNLFIYTGSMENFDMNNFDRNGANIAPFWNKICCLTGYIIGSLEGKDFKTEVKISGNTIDNTLFIEHNTLTYRISPSAELWKLFISIVLQTFEIIRNIGDRMDAEAENNVLNNGTLLAPILGIVNTIKDVYDCESWNIKYEDLKDLVTYKLEEI